MSNVPIRDMTQTGTPSASSQIVFDDGVMRRGTVGSMADAVRPVASLSEAQVGTDNAKTMTPLRVKDSVAVEITASYSATATLTNKTFDTLGAGNVFRINGTTINSITGTGSAVLANSPTLVTPNLGTPSAGNLINATGYPVGSVTGLASGVLSFLVAPNSANLAAAVSDETGTGVVVFNNAPTLVNPVVGTQSPGDNTTKAASTAFVTAAVTAGVSGVSSLNGQTGALNLTIAPQGRLTLTSATPVMGTSVAAATVYYYTPYAGDMIPLFDGTNMVPTRFAERSQLTTDTTKSPAAVAANSVYDLFAWNDAGTIRVTRGPAWTNTTTRGYALTMQNGILLNTSAVTNGPGALRGTWVGTIGSNATSTIDYVFGTAASGGGPSSFMVWNAYNRVSTPTIVEDSGSPYTYTSTTVRQSRASAGNQISFIVGAVVDGVTSNFAQTGQTSAANGSIARWGVGFNNNAAYVKSPAMAYSLAATGVIQTLSNNVTLYPQVGLNTVYACESSDTTASTFNNALAYGTLSALIRN